MDTLMRIAGLLAGPVVIGLARVGRSGLGLLNALSPTRTHTTTAGVPYGSASHQLLDVYTPRQPAPAGGWPVAVFFHGGWWRSGRRQACKFVGAALASRGVLTLVADYRTGPGGRYPDFLVDCALATAHGLAQAAALGGNPRKVFVMGHSAGGYNAAMVALDARWLESTGHAHTELAGWVGLAGAYDFYPIENSAAQPVFNHPDYPPRSQPIEFARPGSPRTFLGAAWKDDQVDPQRNSVGLATRLQASGVPVRLRMYHRVDHITLIGSFAEPLRWMAPVLQDVAAFIHGQAPQ